MRFLADESCDLAVVHALRANGYDVLAVSEITPRAADSDVIRLAVCEKRILLTEDKDFGQLVYAHGQETLGGPGVTVGWLRTCGTAGKPGGNRENKHQPVPLGEPGLLTKSWPNPNAECSCLPCTMLGSGPAAGIEQRA